MADPDYFTTVALQALPDCSAFTEAKILAAASHFTTIVEREIGAPMIPRSYTDTFDGGGLTGLPLSQTPVRSLTSVTVDGAAVTVGLLTANNGVLRYLDGTTFPSTQPANVVVVYSAGEFTTCPGDVKDAVMWATRDRLLGQASDSTHNPRQSSMTNDLGGTVQYVLPGEKRPTGYPELDAVIASYARHTVALGFA